MDSLFGSPPDSDVEEAPPQDLTQNLVAIVPDGDVVLEVHSDDEDAEVVYFQVRRATLRDSSKYFDRLLDPSKFQEGTLVQERLDQLRIEDNDKVTSTAELPRVKIVGIGEVSNVKSIKPLMSDFLNLLHGKRVFGARASPPIVNVANMAIVADRFDACKSLLKQLNRQGALKDQILQREGESDKKRAEELRQRVFIGLTLGHERWTRLYTGELILSGNYMVERSSSKTSTAPWWELSQGVEEELPCRRKAILATLQSLQDYIIERYTSRTQQCRRGYDSSPQCDSFQAGEFVKFLIRVAGLQQLKNCTRYKGDIRTLLEDLKRLPEYQVNTFHSHCGPKKTFNTGLLFISRHLNHGFIGFSPECCSEQRFWASQKKALAWNGEPGLPPANFAMENDGTCMYRGMHERVRNFFMASEQDWTFLKQRMVYHDFEAA